MHRVERARDVVLSTLRKFHSGPFFPFGSSAADRHGFMTGLEDLRPDARMDSQPGIERKSFVVRPLDVIVDADEWISTLLIGADWRDELLKSFRSTDVLHRVHHLGADSLASIIGVDRDLYGRLDVGRHTFFVIPYRLEEDPIPALFGEFS